MRNCIFLRFTLAKVPSVSWYNLWKLEYVMITDSLNGPLASFVPLVPSKWNNLPSYPPYIVSTSILLIII